MWDLSSWTRDWTFIPCIVRQILNHWTTREVPLHVSFTSLKLLSLPPSHLLLMYPHTHIVDQTSEGWCLLSSSFTPFFHRVPKLSLMSYPFRTWDIPLSLNGEWGAPASGCTLWASRVQSVRSAFTGQYWGRVYLEPAAPIPHFVRQPPGPTAPCYVRGQSSRKLSWSLFFHQWVSKPRNALK